MAEKETLARLLTNTTFMTQKFSLLRTLDFIPLNSLFKLVAEEAENNPAFKSKILALHAAEGSPVKERLEEETFSEEFEEEDSPEEFAEEILDKIDSYFLNLDRLSYPDRRKEVMKRSFPEIDHAAKEGTGWLLEKSLFDLAEKLLDDIEKEIRQFFNLSLDEWEVGPEDGFLEELRKLRREVWEKSGKGKMSILDQLFQDIRCGNYAGTELNRIRSVDKLREILSFLLTEMKKQDSFESELFSLLTRVIEKLNLPTKEIEAIILPYRNIQEVRSWFKQILEKREETESLIKFLESERARTQALLQEVKDYPKYQKEREIFRQGILKPEGLLLLADQYKKIGAKEKEIEVLKEIIGSAEIHDDYSLVKRLKNLVPPQEYPAVREIFYFNPKAWYHPKISLAFAENCPEEAIKILDFYQKLQFSKKRLALDLVELARFFDFMLRNRKMPDAVPNFVAKVIIEEIPKAEDGENAKELLEMYSFLCAHPHKQNFDREVLENICQKYPERKDLIKEMRRIWKEASKKNPRPKKSKKTRELPFISPPK